MNNSCSSRIKLLVCKEEKDTTDFEKGKKDEKEGNVFGSCSSFQPTSSFDKLYSSF